MIGKFLQDNDGHWYFVRLEECDKFIQMSRLLEGKEFPSIYNSELYDDFINNFGGYRCESPSQYIVTCHEET